MTLEMTIMCGQLMMPATLLGETYTLSNAVKKGRNIITIKYVKT